MRKLRQIFALKYNLFYWLDSNRNKRFSKTGKRFEGQVKMCKNLYLVVNSMKVEAVKHFQRDVCIYVGKKNKKNRSASENILSGVINSSYFLLIG